MVVIAVVVAPGPVFLLLSRRKLAEVAMRITVSFPSPSVVINNLIIVPHVVVGVIGVVNSIGVMLACESGHRCRKCRRQKQGTDGVRTTNHMCFSLRLEN